MFGVMNLRLDFGWQPIELPPTNNQPPTGQRRSAGFIVNAPNAQLEPSFIHIPAETNARVLLHVNLARISVLDSL